jgi:PAS domain S-box-containing protein
LYVSDVTYDASAKTNSIELGIRVDDADGQMLGIIKLIYNIQDIFDVISESNTQASSSDNAYLLTVDGRLIYSVSGGYGNLVDKKSLIDLFDQSVYYVGKYEGSSQLLSHAHSDGYKDYKSLGWSLVISHKTSDVLAPLDQILRASLLSIFIIVVIMFVMGFYILSFSIVRPIRALNAGATMIRQGQYDRRIGTKIKDEIGDLGRTFDSMAIAIQQSRASIDRQVRDQTKEIGSKARALEEQQLATLNVLEDVEEEKKKTELLAKDLEKFKLAVDNASDHVVVTDSDGIVLYGNRAMEKITGYTTKEALGKKAGVLWRKPMDQAYYRNLWTTIKTKKRTFEAEITNIRKGGQEYQVMISISPIMDNAGKILYFVGLERDITKEKQIDRVKTEFVSLASHQLRTPLSAINWYAEMLLNGDAGKISKTQKEYLNEIYNSNQRMVALVNALLNVSRLELGTFTVEPQPTQLNQVADDIIKELKPQILDKKQKIIRQYQSSLPVISVDPKLIRIVFQNLLSNAVKYTPAKGLITVGLSAQPRSIRLTIKDNGYGIPADAQSRIFTKLFRADNVRIKETDGTGLGLYIVKSIVEQSGGRIWFESTEDQGTTFYVDFPLSGMIKKDGNKALT